MTIEGDECVSTVRECGCFHETVYTPDGEIKLIRLQLCGRCFELAGEALEALDKQRQLTLPLPLTQG